MKKVIYLYKSGRLLCKDYSLILKDKKEGKTITIPNDKQDFRLLENMGNEIVENMKEKKVYKKYEKYNQKGFDLEC